DIHEGIESTLLILRNRLERLKDTKVNPIKVVRNYGNIPPVNCYASQLNQVFMNLLTNGIDALDNVVAGVITIATEQLKNGYIRISIGDNGCGIPENIRESLFDPFFTTKPVGQGTGLGLSISYKIVVEQHRGKLFCQSEVGTGTNFILEIPCALESKAEPVFETDTLEVSV
ncbi:MAG: ATP-binding protein, partial [Cyanobacteria bacterium P01_C01_bin.89]